MTDTEISRRLALAIGYRPQHVMTPGGVVPGGVVLVAHNGWWEKFDHRDERTIFRIAARYKLFPKWSKVCAWKLMLPRHEKTALEDYVLHDCPATCIALAVIEASERGLLS